MEAVFVDGGEILGHALVRAGQVAVRAEGVSAEMKWAAPRAVGLRVGGAAVSRR